MCVCSTSLSMISKHSQSAGRPYIGSRPLHCSTGANRGLECVEREGKLDNCCLHVQGVLEGELRL